MWLMSVRMSEDQHHLHLKDLDAEAMATSLSAISKTISYYASLLERTAANHSTVGLLLTATQNIKDAAERIAPQECDIKVRAIGSRA